jgi:iron(III) transport system substrate-binding protein
MNRRTLLASLLMSTCARPSFAQEAQRPFTLMGTESPEITAPLTQALATALAGSRFSVSYRQARPAQIISLLTSQADSALPDLVLLPTPDLAVQLANEGYSITQTLAGLAGVPHWRNEVFAVGYDPAVFVIRRGGIMAQDIPRSRTELARTLEQNRSRFQGRVGLINIGIDSVAYNYAAQDSLRSTLFWRISGAFGASQARIFDAADELLAALASGRIDLGYNLPLSAVRRFMQTGAEIEVVMPEDYVLALPWTALVPEHVGRQGMMRSIASESVRLLLSESSSRALDDLGLVAPARTGEIENLQTIELGPELLVFLDPLKRSRFLDTWFQMVVQG